MEEGRHDWNINEVTWDRHEMRAEWRGDRSPEQSAGASSAQQVTLLPSCSLVPHCPHWFHQDFQSVSAGVPELFPLKIDSAALYGASAQHACCVSCVRRNAICGCRVDVTMAAAHMVPARA